MHGYLLNTFSGINIEHKSYITRLEIAVFHKKL